MRQIQGSFADSVRTVCFRLLWWVVGCTACAHGPTSPPTDLAAAGDSTADSPALNAPKAEASSTRAEAADPLAPAPLLSDALEPSVRFELDANVPTIEVGRQYWLAAQFEIPTGAHIYWHNPGESGLPTVVEFYPAPGVRIGALRYPGPSRFKSDRGTTSYGYSGMLAVLAPIEFEEGVDLPVELAAQATWLACSDVCTAERGSARLILPRRSAEIASDAQALPGILPGAEASRRISETRLRIETNSELELLEFFPDQLMGPDDSDCQHLPRTDPHVLEVELRYAKPLAGPVTGMVSTGSREKPRYYSVSIP